MPGTCGHEGAAISLPTVWDQPEGPERTFTALPSGDPTAAGTGMYVEGDVHQLPWITATMLTSPLISIFHQALHQLQGKYPMAAATA